mmetsp:Transcript_16443/g.51504  ORF Transcript_16443/g.51504 Transcript_16443/m.51504 type:complete len:411 (+) Transcript_16443:44-1276(+)
MRLVWAVSLCLYGVASVVLVIVSVGDPEDPESRIGGAARWLWRLPEAALSSRACRCVLGERGVARVRRWTRYVCEEPNPVLQIVYLILVSGGYGAMLAVGYPRLPCSTLGAWHRWSGLAAFAATLASFCYASVRPPGYIVDEATAARHDNYPYDDALFRAGKVCPTTGTRKIARSKFCVTRRLCVARFDHFCPFLNASIGEENYRAFLAFLLANLALLAYGAFAAYSLLLDVFRTQRLADAVFIDALTGRTLPASRTVILRYLVAREKALAALLAVCAVMGALIAAFLAFHLWLVAHGMTTNEHYKWRALRRRRPPPALAHLYDRGLLANFAEVLWPLVHRPPHRRPPNPDAWRPPSRVPPDDDDDDIDDDRRRRRRRENRASDPPSHSPPSATAPPIRQTVVRRRRPQS